MPPPPFPLPTPSDIDQHFTVNGTNIFVHAHDLAQKVCLNFDVTGSVSTLSLTSTLAFYPDLQVANLRFSPASGIQSGQTVLVRWDDANTGTGPTTASWNDKVTVVNLATGEILVNGALVAYSNLGGTRNVGAGTSVAQQYSFKLPDGDRGAGTLRVTVQTDSGNAVFEYTTAGTAPPAVSSASASSIAAW